MEESNNENMYERVVRPEDEVEGRLLLDVVVGQSPAILQLLACTDVVDGK